MRRPCDAPERSMLRDPVQASVLTGALHPVASQMGWAKLFGIMAMLMRAPGLDRSRMALGC